MKAKYSAFSATKEMNGSSVASVTAAGLQKHAYLLIAVVFLGTLAVFGFLIHKLHPLVPLIYAIMSIATFIVYAIDKRKAVTARWRIPESTLHLCELLCGWPGAMIAQVTIRHKNAKLPFQIVFWLMFILNVGTLAFLLFR